MRTTWKIFVLIMLAVAGCSMPSAIVSPKQEVAPVTQRLTGDIPETMQYHERSGFHYDFEYDARNLYINIATADPDVVRKIAWFGFSVWIDRQGSKNTDQGFRFPRGGMFPQMTTGQRMQAGQGTFSGGEPRRIFAIAETIDLIGIYGTSTRTVKLHDSRIRVNAEMKEQTLFYSAVIPWEILAFGYDPVTSGGRLSIGLETGHFEQPRMASRQAPAAGPGGGVRPGGGMGGQYPGQYPGRMPDPALMQQRTSEMNRLSRPTTLWLELSFER